jgi:tRNA-dihydrouridine synthase C
MSHLNFTTLSMMLYLPKNNEGCPRLILAPMEGVGDRCFRRAMASIGGFDEAVRDFLRVPMKAHVKSLVTQYEANEITPFPLACQLMGSELSLMAEMAYEIEKRGAPRLDLNCGCPSNTVTGKGAGSSLLRDPDFLYQVAKSMVGAVSIPVTAKLRSGFEDISLFKENLLAAQESGVKYITLHPRTKVDGYGPPARWDLIAEAKAILKIPVVGNGDILTVSDALNMLKQTGCDAIMIGRGSVINPFIFQEIKAHFSGVPYERKWSDLLRYFDVYLAGMATEMPEKSKVSKLKQLMSFFFKGSEALLSKRQMILQATHQDVRSFTEYALTFLREEWIPS